MAIDTSDFKNGIAMIVDGEICQIVEFQHVKPGKGGAFVRTKLRRLKSGATIEKTFRSGEKFEDVFLERVKFQYLMRTGDTLTFMDLDTYEQVEVPVALLGDQADFLKDDMEVLALTANGEVLGYEVPAFGEYEVTQTDPGVRGDTVSGGATKPATLESGAVIQVPFHINIGDVLKVDTRTGSYLERVSKK
ncbi:MAG: elongation factor P [Fimbriimonadaceae bacterium]